MNWYQTHLAVLAYGRAMYLAGRFRASGDSRNHSRALDLSVAIHSRILDQLSNSFTPPF